MNAVREICKTANDDSYCLNKTIQKCGKSKMEVMDHILNNTLLHHKRGRNFYFAPEQFDINGEILEIFPKFLKELQKIGETDMNTIYHNLSLKDANLANYSFMEYIVRNRDDDDILTSIIHYYRNTYMQS